MTHEEAVQRGRALRALREARGWSRAELAFAASVSEQSIYRIEKGKVRNPVTLAAIERVLRREDTDEITEDW